MVSHEVSPSTSESTETRLLAAAAEVFAERGFDNAGVAEIARRAGLTTGAIYSRYRGKAELLVEALDREIAGHLENVVARGEASDAAGILSMLGADILRDDHHHMLSSALLIEASVAARREPELAAMLERRLADDRLRIAKVIEQAKAESVFDPDLDVTAVVTFVQSIGLGFVFFRTLSMPMPDPDSWQTVIDRVIAAALPPHSHS
ncbi:MAG: TetR/AcrR family transcriptional regulator [Acidimicrobiia bacterium]